MAEQIDFDKWQILSFIAILTFGYYYRKGLDLFHASKDKHVHFLVVALLIPLLLYSVYAVWSYYSGIDLISTFFMIWMTNIPILAAIGIAHLNPKVMLFLVIMHFTVIAMIGPPYFPMGDLHSFVFIVVVMFPFMFLYMIGRKLCPDHFKPLLDAFGKKD